MSWRESFWRALRRITGVSTPLGGISWQPSEPEQSATPRPAADVRVRLVGSGRDARIVIANVGTRNAYDVHLDFDLGEGKGSPLIKDESNAKLPVEILREGDRVELIAALSFDTGVTFRPKWWWREEDGTLQERNEKVSLMRP